MRLFSAVTVPSLLLVTVLTGCHISTHKNGDNDNVNIGTPFGSMQVKTTADAAGLGITPYPGAQLVKKNKNDGAADVNMSFGSFHLGVKAASYTTPDGTDKVLEFYKNDLSKYGVVLHCEGKHAVGEPSRTADGLTCDSDASTSGHMSWDTDAGGKTSAAKIELRAGSKEHQHVVALEPRNGGTEIGMVALDLPSRISKGSHKDSD